MSYKPFLLAILDGWGINESHFGNAVYEAKTPRLDEMFRKYPHSKLLASGFEVGLPEGQMGNSEVGHQNIGAGRIVFQNLPRITKSIKDGNFFTNPALLVAINNAKANNSGLHLMGLVSDGGVHSHITHLYAFLELAKQHGLTKVYVHCFMDGRDTAPDSGLGFIKDLEAKIAEIGCGEIASITGRYYAMDRDKNWDRLVSTYNMLTLGEGETAPDAVSAITQSYAKNVQDEFILPTLVTKTSTPKLIDYNDSIIFFNFRPDRAKQLSYAFVKEDFAGFPRKKWPKTTFVTLTQYSSDLADHVAYPPIPMTNTLGEILAKHHLNQLRIAETEKFAHVTRFFNGDSDDIFPQEERVLISSPKVATYDLKPEMSADEVTQELLKLLDEQKYDVIILNFANCDMVGHTGFMQSAIKAVETVDTCIGKVADKILSLGGTMLITADHGNAECMMEADGKPMTAHTTTPVPLVLVGPEVSSYKLQDGILADIAPTMLELLKIEKPSEMDGKSLLSK